MAKGDGGLAGAVSAVVHLPLILVLVGHAIVNTRSNRSDPNGFRNHFILCSQFLDVVYQLRDHGPKSLKFSEHVG